MARYDDLLRQGPLIMALLDSMTRKPPPDQWWKQPYTPFRGGPHDPGPNDNQTFLGQRAANAGAYRIPGFGDWARQQNVDRVRQRHAFNPGRNSRTWS